MTSLTRTKTEYILAYSVLKTERYHSCAKNRGLGGFINIGSKETVIELFPAAAVKILH